MNIPLSEVLPVSPSEPSPLESRGSAVARTLSVQSEPRSPQAHLFQTVQGSYLLVADGTRLYRVDDETLPALVEALDGDGSGEINTVLTELGLDGFPHIDDHPLTAPPIRAFSLAIAQKCNMGCTYCYAQEGSFGGSAKNMPLETALKAVELLFQDVGSGDRVNLSFLGGEPLYNRSVLRAATERAVELADAKSVHATFSITTNGTLLTPDDGEFFERNGFAVTISLDGVGEVHDRLRSFKSGKGTYEHIIRRVQPLLAMQRSMQVSTRVTVTPRNLRLRETLDELIDMGFHSVGFSPMLSSPAGRDEMQSAELEVMLEQMVACGEAFERQIIASKRYPFMNMYNAMREIHRGTHRPYPCGAGAGYLGVSADGDLFACHRFVGDEVGAMGDLSNGVDRTRQAIWLAERHVHWQEPCRGCWARYLCGGGCHHEVIRRGRPACNYIRGWLHYCLQAYTRLSQARPDYFRPYAS